MACGAKVTRTVQLPPARTGTLQDDDAIAKSPGSAPANPGPVITRGTVPVFEIVTACDAETVCMACSPKLTRAGETWLTGIAYRIVTDGCSIPALVIVVCRSPGAA